jgi:hypothetical protein
VLECYIHFEVSIITFGVKKLTIWSLIIDNYEVVIKEKIVKSIGLMFVRTTKKYQNLFGCIQYHIQLVTSKLLNLDRILYTFQWIQ